MALRKVVTDREWVEFEAKGTLYNIGHEHVYFTVADSKPLGVNVSGSNDTGVILSPGSQTSIYPAVDGLTLYVLGTSSKGSYVELQPFI